MPGTSGSRNQTLISAIAVLLANLLLGGVLTGCTTTVSTTRALTMPSAVAGAQPPGVKYPAQETNLAGSADESCQPRPWDSLRPPAEAPAAGSTQAVDQEAQAAAPAPAKPLVQGQNLDRILAQGKLIVGTDESLPHLSFRNLDHELLGLQPDIAREIARAIFGDPDRVQFRTMTTVDRLAALESDAPAALRTDLVIRAMPMTCAQAQRVAFSTAYLTTAGGLLVRGNSGIRSRADLGTGSACAVEGSPSLERLTGFAGHSYQVVSARNIADCVVLLRQRRVVAVSAPGTVLNWFTEQDPTLLVLADGDPGMYGVAIPLGEDDLVRFVNAVLEHLRAAPDWNARYSNWLGRATPMPQATYRD
jgi:polar amino acid transport system substrate-binding protein